LAVLTPAPASSSRHCPALSAVVTSTVSAFRPMRLARMPATVTNPLPSSFNFSRMSLPLWAPIFFSSRARRPKARLQRVLDGDLEAQLDLAQRIRLRAPGPGAGKARADDPPARGRQLAIQHDLGDRRRRLLGLGKASPRRMDPQHDLVARPAISGGAPVGDRLVAQRQVKALGARIRPEGRRRVIDPVA